MSWLWSGYDYEDSECVAVQRQVATNLTSWQGVSPHFLSHNNLEVVYYGLHLIR
jgi:hypothetical protein